MVSKVRVSAIYECSLERAFITAILCDITKIHTGFIIIPKVTHCADDENWGKIGYSKKVYVAKSLTQKGGWASDDKVIERVENKYWKIEVSNFQSWLLGFSKFVGEWKTTELETGKVLIEYTYSLYATNPILYPINWVFAKTIWRVYMKRVLENIRKMAYHKEPYLYE